MELLLVDRTADGVMTVVLNRPEALNALSYALLGEIDQVFRALATDESVSCVVLTGAGRAFSAGVDLTELGTRPSSGPEDVKQAAMRAIRRCPVPIIAAVNGVAVTGGFELALGCDIIVASSAARFADTHARVGVVPLWGLTQHLPRLIGYSRARELSFSGRFIDAVTAERWGLVNRVVEPEELMPECLRLAAEIAANDGHAVRTIKRSYLEGDVGLGPGLEIELTLGAPFNRAVPQSEIAQRRESVKARNRSNA